MLTNSAPPSTPIHPYHPNPILPIQSSLNLEGILRQSCEIFRSICEFAPIGIALACVKTHRIIRTNPAYHHILGYSPDDIENFTFLNITHPDDIEADLQKFRQLLNNEISRFQIEKRLKAKNGDWVWVHMTATLIRDDAGVPLYSLAMIEDISDRKQALEALQRSEAKNRAILEALPDMIFHYDHNGVYLDYVPAKHLQPYTSPKQFLGKSIREVLPQPVAETLQAAISQAILTNQTQICKYNLSLHGICHYYEARVVACNSTETLAIVRNTTNYKNAQAALRSSRSQVETHDQQLQSLTRQLYHTRTQLKQAEPLVRLGTLITEVAKEFQETVFQLRTQIGTIDEDFHKVLSLLCLYEQYYPRTVEEIEHERSIVDPQALITEIPHRIRHTHNRLEQANDFALFLQTLARIPASPPRRIDIYRCLNQLIHRFCSRLETYHSSEIVLKHDGPQHIQCYPEQLYQALLHLFHHMVERLAFSLQRHSYLLIQTRTLPNNQIQIILQSHPSSVHSSHSTKTAFPSPIDQKASSACLLLSRYIIESIHHGRLNYTSSLQPTVRLEVQLPITF
ncbi:MAG: PAS domain S-box protein [Leptolyngbyaceae cyanobacterium bins.302]|nr:PAS domain S-box protein [Leptolyngbyaceae cyanobacterium bins.302]